MNTTVSFLKKKIKTKKYIGNLFVNFLTKVVGKAIGLVGKGILQGLGRSSSK